MKDAAKKTKPKAQFWRVEIYANGTVRKSRPQGLSPGWTETYWRRKVATAHEYWPHTDCDRGGFVQAVTREQAINKVRRKTSHMKVEDSNEA